MLDINEPSVQQFLSALSARRDLYVRRLIMATEEKEADVLRGRIQELELLTKWIIEPPEQAAH